MDLVGGSNKRRSLTINSNAALASNVKINKTSTSDNANQSKPHDSYFNENVSQFFRSQFSPEIPCAQASKRAVVSGLNLTQFDCGFSQTLNESQFNDTISPGQTRFSAFSSQLLNRTVNPNDSKATTVNNGDDDDGGDVAAATEFDSGNQPQCSQIFLNEVSALHSNITSMIDETLMANKINATDIGDNEEKFSVFRSNVTMSQYVQLQRPADENVLPVTATTATYDDQLQDDENEFLAQFVMDNDWSQMIANGSESNAKLTKSTSNGESNVQVVARHRPVSAANFCVMGPFFGLPLKVKKLINEFKGINDLYGERHIL